MFFLISTKHQLTTWADPSIHPLHLSSSVRHLIRLKQPFRLVKRTFSGSEDPGEIVQSSEEDNSERQETGVVKSAIYKRYWVAVGIWLSPAILLSLTLMQATRNFSDVW